MQGSPASRSVAACSTSWRAASICVAMSASRKATAWWLAIAVPKRLALLGIERRRLEGGARHADRLRRDADASAFEIGERDPVALALLAEQQVRRELELLEDDLRVSEARCPSLVLELRDPPARPLGRHDEGADALLAGAGIGDGEDHAPAWRWRPR